MRRTGQPCRRLLVALLALCTPPGQSMLAQQTSDTQVEAAYIYNFAKFVEWPERKFANPTAPIRFCVLNDFSFEADLNRAVKGKQIAGRALEVIQVRDAAQAMKCHVLFINSAQEHQLRHVLDTVRGSSVLTVGETDSFAEQGGIIDFFLDDDRVQFRINNKAAREAGLYLSSRLLSLAKRVME